MKKYLILALFFLLGANWAIAQNSPARRNYIDIVLTPDHADWNYETGEQATVLLRVLKFGVPMELDVSYEIGPEMLPAEEKGSVRTTHGAAELKLGTSGQPGFRVAKVTVEYEGNRYSDQVKVGYSPEQIRPTVALPVDFTQFWAGAKAEAARVPMDAKVTLLPEYCTQTVDVYLVDLQNFRPGQRLYGFLCKPKAPGQYPVLMSPPGAGVKRILPSTAYAEAGFISLSIEIHGINPLLDVKTYGDISRAMGSYMMTGMDDRDHYYYKKVYLGCVRAIDYLCSLPEWDGRNVVVTGGSQGGALTIVTAALDSRVTALSSFYPALCDMEGYLHDRAGGWPHLFNAINQPYTDTPEKRNTIAYYDVVNFARQLRVPGFYSFGYNDNTCPPTSVYAAINVIDARKFVEVTPISGHWRFGETDARSTRWLRQQCGLE